MVTMLLVLALFPGDDDAAATAALDKFKTEYKAKEAATRATAVLELSQTQHDKVWAKLGQLLTTDEKEVRIAAAKGLSAAQENRKKPVIYLINGAAANAKEPSVLAAILEALGKLKEIPAGSEIEKHFKTKETAVAKAAIEAAGGIGSRTSVQPLIEALRWLEASAQEAPSYGGGGGGGKTPGVNNGGTVDEAARERERMLKPLILKALTAITKTSHSSAKEWDEWWRTDGPKFMAGK